jgi:hypothetical protein
LGLADGALWVGEVTAFEDDAFGGEEVEFFGELGAAGLAAIAAWGEVRGDDAVARDCGGEGVGAEGLADGAGGVATDAAGEGGVGDDAAGRDFLERRVDFGGEGGGGVYRFQGFSFW